MPDILLYRKRAVNNTSSRQSCTQMNATVLTFKIKNGRFGFKLTAPYSDERRRAASEQAKKNTENLQRN